MVSASVLCTPSLEPSLSLRSLPCAHGVSPPQRSPFRSASPLVHTNPSTYNAIIAASFLGRRRFGRGLASEPLTLLALYCELLRQQPPPKGNQASGSLSRRKAKPVPTTTADASDEAGAARGDSLRITGELARWCEQQGLAPKQVQLFCSSVANLRRLVGAHLKLPASALQLRPDSFSPTEIGDAAATGVDRKSSLLRLLLVMSSADVLLSAHLPKPKKAAQLQLLVPMGGREASLCSGCS